MRGDDREPDSMFSYVSAEQRVPKDHPLRALRGLVERLLMEQLDYNLFRWFVGMDMDEPIWDPMVFTKNRDRRLNQDIAVEGGRTYQGPRTNVTLTGRRRERPLMLPIVLEVS